MEIDEKKIIETYENYVDELQKKEWYDLTTEELHLVKDSKRRSECRKRIDLCLRYVINPLYNSIKKRGKFKFSVANKYLTCQIMVRELFEYYKKQGFEKQDIINIAYEADSTKKY